MWKGFPFLHITLNCDQLCKLAYQWILTRNILFYIFIHTQVQVLYYWGCIQVYHTCNLPLNFFGGFDKSPASGCTTHLSSTKLKSKATKIQVPVHNCVTVSFRNFVLSLDSSRNKNHFALSAMSNFTICGIVLIFYHIHV